MHFEAMDLFLKVFTSGAFSRNKDYVSVEGKEKFLQTVSYYMGAEVFFISFSGVYDFEKRLNGKRFEGDPWVQSTICNLM